MAGKVTVGLSSHWLCITAVNYPTMGSWPDVLLNQTNINILLKKETHIRYCNISCSNTGRVWVIIQYYYPTTAESKKTHVVTSVLAFEVAASVLTKQLFHQVTIIHKPHMLTHYIQMQITTRPAIVRDNLLLHVCWTSLQSDQNICGLHVAWRQQLLINICCCTCPQQQTRWPSQWLSAVGTDRWTDRHWTVLWRLLHTMQTV